MKNILITGGSGFVGSNLAEYLIKKGIEVTSLDNYFTGSKINHKEGVEYITGETKDISKLLSGRSFSHIYHLGEYSRVEQSFEDIDLVFKYNHQSIYEVLKYAHKNRSKFIYSGSSTKFGDDGANGYASPYAWTKRNNTELIKTYAQWNNLDYAIAYFYNVYGDNEISQGRYATLIAKYLSLVNEGRTSLPVVKPGSQTRNFTHVADIVDGLYLVGVHGQGDNYGIGSDKAYSILDLVEMLGCEVEWLPERRGNRLSAPIVNDKLKALGWEPKNNLKDFLISKINK